MRRTCPKRRALRSWISDSACPAPACGLPRRRVRSWPTERVRRVAPIQNKRAAERYELELRQELIEGQAAAKEDLPKKREPSPTLTEFCKPFLEVYATTNNKPSGVEAKRTICNRHLVPAFGLKRLDQIGVRDIEAFKALKLKDGYAPKTVNNFLAVLRKLLLVAVDWEKLEHAPRVQWLKIPDPEFDFFTFEEAERLVGGAPSDWKAMIVVGLRTGLRIGELLALRWDDVDLIAGRLVVRRSVSRGLIGTPKNGRSRAEGRPAPRRLACASAYLRLAPSDARGTAEGRSGAA